MTRAPLPSDQLEDLSARRADRQPNADLPPAEADEIGQHAVAANAGEQERERAEHDQQVAGEFLLERRGSRVVAQPAHVIERNARIELAHHALQIETDGLEPSRRADVQHRRGRVELQDGHEDVRLRPLVHASLLDVTGDTNDRDPLRRLIGAWTTEDEPAADRIAPIPIHADHRFTDDGHSSGARPHRPSTSRAP